ncbi:MAG: hypothetical protein ACWIPJ_05620 [Polaribacter sp.]
MKNFFLLIATIILTTSCSKNDDILETQNTNLEKIDQVLNTKNLTEQKLEYSFLNENENEKYKIWKDRLTKISTSKVYNKKQIELIKEFNKKLKLSYFIEDSDGLYSSIR